MQERTNRVIVRKEFIAFAKMSDNRFPAINGLEATLGPKYVSIITRVIEGFDQIKWHKCYLHFTSEFGMFLMLFLSLSFTALLFFLFFLICCHIHRFEMLHGFFPPHNLFYAISFLLVFYFFPPLLKIVQP